jgi:hypothetical protein
MLEIDGQEEVDPVRLKDHITDYYKQLFGKVEAADMRLDPNLWPANQQIQHVDNEALIKPFTLEELDITIRQMKNNTAPGPDGFSMEFYKAF